MTYLLDLAIEKGETGGFQGQGLHRAIAGEEEQDCALSVSAVLHGAEVLFVRLNLLFEQRIDLLALFLTINHQVEGTVALWIDLASILLDTCY